MTGLSGRASYVYKNIRNVWGEVDVGAPRPTRCRSRSSTSGPRRAWPARATTRRSTRSAVRRRRHRPRLHQPEDDNADFQNVEFAVNRRFSGKWMMLTSFGYTWSNDVSRRPAGTRARRRITTTTYRPINACSATTASRRRRSGTTRSSAATCCRMRSGSRDRGGAKRLQWGRTTSVNVPGRRRANVRVEPITANRDPTVPILDVRARQVVRFGTLRQATRQMDVFNVTNPAR